MTPVPPKPQVFPEGDLIFHARAAAMRLYDSGVGCDFCGLLGRDAATLTPEDGAQVSVSMTWPRFKEFVLFACGAVMHYEETHGEIPPPPTTVISTPAIGKIDAIH